jgi:hypothetical protein
VTRGESLGMLPAMKQGLLSSLAVGSLLLGTGCTGGTETGNPIVTGSLSYTGYSSAPDQIGVREGGEVATVSSAWFELDTVSVSSLGCTGGQGDDFDVAALGLGDHAAGAHVSTSYMASEGNFCSVELPLSRVADDASNGPEELRGHSLLLTGQLADGTEFSLVSDAQPRLVLEAEAGGFELSVELSDAVVAFDFATWLGDLDFAAATLDAGRIVISPDSNAELLEQFESNLAAGVVLYRDADGDGFLDAEPEELARVR